MRKVLYQSLTSFWRNFGPFFFTMLLQFIEVCGHLFMHSSRHSISVGLRSRLRLGHCNTLILFFFSHSSVDLLVIFRSLSSCMTKFWPSFSCRMDDLTFDSGQILWYTDEFMVDAMTVRCP